MTPRRNEPEPINIRGHHILGIAHHKNNPEILKDITGRYEYGNYETVIKPALDRIISNPNAMVRVTTEESALCKECRNYRPDCEKNGTISNFDKRVLETLGLEDGQKIRTKKLVEITEKNEEFKNMVTEERERIRQLLKNKHPVNNANTPK